MLNLLKVSAENDHVMQLRENCLPTSISGGASRKFVSTAPGARLLRHVGFHYTPGHTDRLNMAKSSRHPHRRCPDHRWASRQILQREVGQWQFARQRHKVNHWAEDHPAGCGPRASTVLRTFRHLVLRYQSGSVCDRVQCSAIRDNDFPTRFHEDSFLHKSRKFATHGYACHPYKMSKVFNAMTF